jgi:hypothetical protein
VKRAGVLSTGLSCVVVACALVLTGCVGGTEPAVTTSASPYSATVASKLQAGVQAVTSSAAGGDPATALGRLDELAVTLADARARGLVTTARFDSITASIALVRADLQAAIAALANQEQPGNSEKPGKGDGNKGD